MKKKKPFFAKGEQEQGGGGGERGSKFKVTGVNIIPFRG